MSNGFKELKEAIKEELKNIHEEEEFKRRFENLILNYCDDIAKDQDILEVINKVSEGEHE